MGRLNIHNLQKKKKKTIDARTYCNLIGCEITKNIFSIVLVALNQITRIVRKEEFRTCLNLHLNVQHGLLGSDVSYHFKNVPTYANVNKKK